MIPQGPYRSAFSDSDFYIVKAIVFGQVAFSIVPNGVQPADGLFHATEGHAKEWLKDNGYELRVK